MKKPSQLKETAVLVMVYLEGEHNLEEAKSILGEVLDNTVCDDYQVFKSEVRNCEKL